MFVRRLTIIAIALAGIALLVGVSLLLNAQIKELANGYEGAIAFLSFASSAMLTAATLLYRHNLRFHAWCHQCLLVLRPYHTYWSFAFRIDCPADEAGADCAAPALVDEVIAELRDRFPRLKVLELSDLFARITLDGTFNVRMKQSQDGLFIDSEHRFTVPSYLYDRYRASLTTLAEVVSRGMVSADSRYSVAVHFEGKSANPYYGFFVRHVPSSDLIDFHVAFRCENADRCRVEAGIDRVEIDGPSYPELFNTLSKVLSYEALPREALEPR